MSGPQRTTTHALLCTVPMTFGPELGLGLLSRLGDVRVEMGANTGLVPTRCCWRFQIRTHRPLVEEARFYYASLHFLFLVKKISLRKEQLNNSLESHECGLIYFHRPGDLLLAEVQKLMKS